MMMWIELIGLSSCTCPTDRTIQRKQLLVLQVLHLQIEIGLAFLKKWQH